LYSKKFVNFHHRIAARAIILQHNRAEDRFSFFVNRFPHAERYLLEVSQKLIASYLGVTPETYSRVKKQYYQKV